MNKRENVVMNENDLEDDSFDCDELEERLG